MKKLTMLLVLIFLTGCSQTVNFSQIKRAEFFCKDKFGISKIDIDKLGAKVYCVNGESEFVRKIILRGGVDEQD
jgi:hypothetical protein